MRSGGAPFLNADATDGEIILATNEQMFRRHVKPLVAPGALNHGWQQENFGDARLGNVSVSDTTSAAVYTSASEIPIRR